MKNGGIAAVVWAPHEQRTAQYAKRLNATLHNVHYLRYKQPIFAPFKYIPQCIRTWEVLHDRQPSYVYVANPPIFAAYSVLAYCRLAGLPFVMDTHSPALYCRKWGWSVPLQRILARQADINIVDQQRFKSLFDSWGANVLVLERPPLCVSGLKLGPKGCPGSFSITVVSTFADDEPIDLVLDCAARLPKVRFFVLGDTALAKKRVIQNAPGNVTFTGYLTGDSYWNRLYASSAVMVLTTFPFSLLGGAQEAMALGVPLILSRQPALTEYFTRGTVFVNHSIESLMDGVNMMQSQSCRLASEIAELSAERTQRWEREFAELESRINRSSRAPQCCQ